MSVFKEWLHLYVIIFFNLSPKTVFVNNSGLFLVYFYWIWDLKKKKLI